ncbi:MAG: hypothetical protein ACT4QF_07020 [Sporichthyaceae bacterium]
MTATESNAPRPTRRRALRVGVGLAVVGVWAAAVIAVVGQTGATDPAPAEPTETTGRSLAPAPVAFAAPAKRIVLPAGAEQVDEYPSRFPHRPDGAAAAAVALTRYSASLDYPVVDEVIRLYAAPGAEAAEAADGAAAIAVSAGRARLELPMTGPAPLDASVFAEPFAVRWTAVDEDTVFVSVLSAVEYRSGPRQFRELVAATTQWRWIAAAQDWRVVPGETEDPPAVAELGSVEFNEAGWTALAERRP